MMKNTESSISTPTKPVKSGVALESPMTKFNKSGLLVALGLILLVYIADGALQNISNGQSMNEGSPYFFTEIVTVAICIVLPALYFHFGGSSRSRTTARKNESAVAEMP